MTKEAMIKQDERKQAKRLSQFRNDRSHMIEIQEHNTRPSTAVINQWMNRHER